MRCKVAVITQSRLFHFFLYRLLGAFKFATCASSTLNVAGNVMQERIAMPDLFIFLHLFCVIKRQTPALFFDF